MDLSLFFVGLRHYDALMEPDVAQPHDHIKTRVRCGNFDPQGNARIPPARGIFWAYPVKQQFKGYLESWTSPSDGTPGPEHISFGFYKLVGTHPRFFSRHKTDCGKR